MYDARRWISIRANWRKIWSRNGLETWVHTGNLDEGIFWGDYFGRVNAADDLNRGGVICLN